MFKKLVLFVYVMTASIHCYSIESNTIKNDDSLLSSKWTQIVQRVKNRIVKITARIEHPQHNSFRTKKGSGFFINNDGLIITSSAIVENTQSIKIHVFNGREFEAKIVGISSHVGLALLELSKEGVDFVKNNLDFSALVFGNSDQLHKGDSLLSVGCFIDKQPSIAECNFIGYENDCLMMKGRVPFIHGGGPVFNSDGDIVGILSSSIMASEIYYCIPAVRITDALENFH